MLSDIDPAGTASTATSRTPDDVAAQAQLAAVRTQALTPTQRALEGFRIAASTNAPADGAQARAIADTGANARTALQRSDVTSVQSRQMQQLLEHLGNAMVDGTLDPQVGDIFRDSLYDLATADAGSSKFADALADMTSAAKASGWEPPPLGKYKDPADTLQQRLAIAETGQTDDSCVRPGLPDATGLSDADKASLYSDYMRDAVGAFNHEPLEKQVDGNYPQAMLDAYDKGQAVILGVRNATGLDANSGRGAWDDKVLVLQKQADASGRRVPKVLYEGAYTSDPAGHYQPGNAHYVDNATSRDLPDVDGAKDARGAKLGDVGRLHAGVHEFEWGNSTGHGAPVYTDDQGHGYNVLRSVSPEPADRYYGGAWHFDPSGFANQHGYHDPLPPADRSYDPAARTQATNPYNAGTTMLFHRGYPNGFTGSAGCQTFPVGKFEDFTRVLAGTGQSNFFYALTGE